MITDRAQSVSRGSNTYRGLAILISQPWTSLQKMGETLGDATYEYVNHLDPVQRKAVRCAFWTQTAEALLAGKDMNAAISSGVKAVGIAGRGIEVAAQAEVSAELATKGAAAEVPVPRTEPPAIEEKPAPAENLEPQKRALGHEEVAHALANLPAKTLSEADVAAYFNKNHVLSNSKLSAAARELNSTKAFFRGMRLTKEGIEGILRDGMKMNRTRFQSIRAIFTATHAEDSIRYALDPMSEAAPSKDFYSVVVEIDATGLKRPAPYLEPRYQVYKFGDDVPVDRIKQIYIVPAEYIQNGTGPAFVPLIQN